ncbi:hypothetical protein G7Y89_g15308 [Cudoniella acicularis]|uniref:2EXR domain-containing protein n=1 Tax=Cudoniella acicularis TaxID=354080 RepID=A0A8H4VMN5_9HELO|nr:hypothetical protein G7Y89_g15308 [Cudoniella acicularis]
MNQLKSKKHTKKTRPNEAWGFKKLSAELQIEILGKLAAIPRYVDVYCTGFCYNSRTAVPAILHVCRLSRETGMKYYNPEFGTSWTDPNGTIWLSPPQIYVNFEPDIICYLESYPCIHFICETIASICAENGTRRLVLPLSSLRDNFSGMAEQDSPVWESEALKEIVFIVEGEYLGWATTHGQKVKKLEFVENLRRKTQTDVQAEFAYVQAANFLPDFEDLWDSSVPWEINGVRQTRASGYGFQQDMKLLGMPREGAERGSLQTESRRRMKDLFFRLVVLLESVIQCDLMMFEQEKPSSGESSGPGAHVFSPNPKLPPPKTANVERINIEALKLEQSAPIIRNVSHVASYNWLDGVSPTILVPGSPPAWTPPEGKWRLKPDRGDVFRDINAARHPEYPIEPAIRSVLAMQPDFDLQSIDVVGCGSTLGNLLRFAGSRCKPFRFEVDVVAGTVFFLRKENSATELITDLRGYGHTFPEKYTTWDKEVRNSCSHQRLIRYEFGSLRFLVRSETDGYVRSRVNSISNSEKQTGPTSLEDDFATLAVKNTSGSTGDVLQVQVAGTSVAQDQIFDIKTRSRCNVLGMDEIFPRLWINQTPKFLLAYHEFGVFDTPEIQDVRGRILNWERNNSALLTRFHAVVERVVGLAKSSNKKQLEVYWDGQGPLRVATLDEDGTRALPGDLLRHFEVAGIEIVLYCCLVCGHELSPFPRYWSNRLTGCQRPSFGKYIVAKELHKESASSPQALRSHYIYLQSPDSRIPALFTNFNMFPNLLTLALAATAYALPAATNASVSPDPTQVSIKGITYGGSGCPQGTLGSFISADRQTFTLIFDNYVASIGPGVAVTENRKNCQLNLELAYPGGFQYSILSTVYRGYVSLDAGVNGLQASTFYFSGESGQTTTSTTFKGPIDGNYEAVDNVNLASTVWSPCGSTAALNINSQVRLTANSSSINGFITDDSIDGKITFVVGLQWQKC